MYTDDSWRKLAATAEGQYGLLTSRQIYRELSRHQLANRARLGLIEPVDHGVWRLTGAQPSWRQQVMAACLSIGPPVAACGPTAAALWSFDAIAPTEAIHLSVPPRRGNHSTAAVVIHRQTLDDRDIGLRHDIRVTRPLRTLLDMAGSVSAEVLARSLDEGIRRDVIRPAHMRAALSQWPGQKGWRALSDALERRLEGVGDSVLEDTVFGWLVAAGLSAPVRQHQVLLPDGLVLLDLAYPAAKVGVECDGWEWHKDRRRFDRDRARLSELELTGWLVIPVTSAHSQREVVGWVRRALVRQGFYD